MAFVTVHGTPTSYAGVELYTGFGRTERRETFNTGAPLLDYLTALAVADLRNEGDCIMGSSSIDDFGADGGEELDATLATGEQFDTAWNRALHHVDNR